MLGFAFELTFLVSTFVFVNLLVVDFFHLYVVRFNRYQHLLRLLSKGEKVVDEFAVVVRLLFVAPEQTFGQRGRNALFGGQLRI